MEQLHRRLTAEQVKVLFGGYSQGILDRATVVEGELLALPVPTS